MKALIFDTETTGMVEFRKPPEDPSQPDLIQLGMLLVETDDWTPRARSSFLVQLNEGVRIDPGAREAHGISEEDCARYGVVPIVACSLFNQACLQSDVIVAHNLRPSDTAHLDRRHVLGIVTEVGGPTSHFAILAKALKIPAVVGLEGIVNHVRQDDPIGIGRSRSTLHPGEVTQVSDLPNHQV